MSAGDDWAGILDAGEDILWQGRPDGAVVLTPGKIFELVFGLFFAGFALFWMSLAMAAGGVLWLFGMIHFSVGIGIIWHATLGDAYIRRRTWYTLTDRRAFVATDLPVMGKRLKDYPIGADTPLELVDAEPGTIWFAETRVRSKNGSRRKQIGFERIAEARAVYALMRGARARDRRKDDEI